MYSRDSAIFAHIKLHLPWHENGGALHPQGRSRTETLMEDQCNYGGYVGVWFVSIQQSIIQWNWLFVIFGCWRPRQVDPADTIFVKITTASWQWCTATLFFDISLVGCCVWSAHKASHQPIFVMASQWKMHFSWTLHDQKMAQEWHPE